jgi:hypothetical protein
MCAAALINSEAAAAITAKTKIAIPAVSSAAKAIATAIASMALKMNLFSQQNSPWPRKLGRARQRQFVQPLLARMLLSLFHERETEPAGSTPP